MSRANDHVNLEVDAIIPISAQSARTTKRLTTAVVAPLDCRASYRSWTIGEPVGLSSALSIFVALKRRPIRKPKPSRPFIISDRTMLLGTVRGAFSISSPRT